MTPNQEHRWRYLVAHSLHRGDTPRPPQMLSVFEEGDKRPLGPRFPYATSYRGLLNSQPGAIALTHFVRAGTRPRLLTRNTMSRPWTTPAPLHLHIFRAVATGAARRHWRKSARCRQHQDTLELTQHLALRSRVDHRLTCRDEALPANGLRTPRHSPYYIVGLLSPSASLSPCFTACQTQVTIGSRDVHRS